MSGAAMEVDLTGRAARMTGAAGPLPTLLRAWLERSGARMVEEGLPDLLVLSAPLLPDDGFDWEALAETACRAGAEMKARGEGRMLFLLSAAAALPLRRQAGLSQRMAALQALMRTLAMELGPNVAVNALGTGAIYGEGEAGLVSGEEAMVGHAGVGRAGTLEEACNAALFLCDPENTYLTGQLLLADGGWAAGYGRNF